MTLREPRLTPVAITDLRPTQITVGMREVKAKRKHWREIAEKKKDKDADFLGKHMIPVILGPKQRHYVIDHHHLALALHEEGVKEVAVTVIANLSMLEPDSFWFVMDNHNWMHPFDDAGRRRHYKDIPKSVTGLVDDPYPLAGGRIAPCRRLRQGYDAVQRIHLGGFPAPAREAQIGRARLRARAREGVATGQEHGRQLSARLVRPVAGGMSRCRIAVL